MQVASKWQPSCISNITTTRTKLYDHTSRLAKSCYYLHLKRGVSFYSWTAWFWRFCIFAISLKRTWPFIWTNLNSFNPRMLCAKFHRNWPSDSGERDFLMPSSIFTVISLWKSQVFYWNNSNPLHPMIIFTKFAWNWFSCSGEDVAEMS